MTEANNHNAANEISSQGAQPLKPSDSASASSTSSSTSSAPSQFHSKPINPAVRRTAEGGRHHQRSHSIDTKDRTSPILGLGSLQGDIAKFLSGGGGGETSFGGGHSGMSPNSVTGWGAEGGQPSSRRASGSASVSPTNLGFGSGLAKPVPRKVSNGSSSSEGSPENATSPETRRLSLRISDKSQGSGVKDASRRTASPARAFAGAPISPRLQVYGAGFGSGHARRMSSETSGPQRVPSPILLPSSSPPNLPTNPDHQHSWDSVWPRASTPDRGQGGRADSPALSGSSSSPSDLAAGGSRSPSVHGAEIARSPARSGDLGPGVFSSSPTIGRPKARRPHELRGSSSSPTLRVSMPTAGREDPDAPKSPREQRQIRTIETSKSEPIPRIGFSPILGSSQPNTAAGDPVKPSSGNAGQQPNGVAPSPAHRILSPPLGSVANVSAEQAVATSFVGDAATRGSSDQGTFTKLAVPSSISPSEASPASPRLPFLQLSSPPTAPNGLSQEAPLAESPPKTRSFIAMPPRSGYELSDDPDDVGSEEDGSSSGRGSVGTNDDDDDEDLDDRDDNEEDMDVADEEIDMDDKGCDSSGRGDAKRLGSPGFALSSKPVLPKRPSLTRSSAVPTPPSVLDPMASAEVAARALSAGKGSEGASLLSYFKDQFEQNVGEPTVDAQMDLEAQGPDVVQPSALGLHTGGDEVMDEGIKAGANLGDGSLQADQIEENLNTLERIFLFAKSDLSYHRVLVSSSLPDWIREVELNDAVEYIIPLLNGLGTDELDVCAAFAPELARVMWFFFRNCPLAELDADSAAPAEGDEVGDEFARRPRISVSTFTSLLCALLLNQNNLIAGATQQSLVQFFCRLINRDPDVPKDEQAQKSEEQVQAEQHQLPMDGYITHALGRDRQPVPHEPYDFDERAKDLIRNELLENVAFAIAHLSLEQSRDQANISMADSSMSEPMIVDVNPEGEPAGKPEIESQTSVANGEPRAAEQGGDEVADNAGQGDKENDPTASRSQEAGGDTDMLDESQLLDSWHGGSSPFAQDSSPTISEYKADLDEEAAVGRMASVSLLAALCAEELISNDLLLSRLLPEILGMSDDPAFFVRKEVAGALGPLAKNLDHGTVVEQILPAFEKAMNDRIWHVRQAACFSLPTIFGQLEPKLKHERTVSSLRTFVNDISRNVRLAALEIVGESIYMFHEDKDGVPDELVRFFTGEPFDGPLQQGEASISFDQSLGGGVTQPAAVNDESSMDSANLSAGDDDRDSLLASFGFSSKGDMSLIDARWGSEFGAADTDPERPLVMAFNVPAVILTLGGDQWSRLRETHTELTKHLSSNVRKSLAASLHEIAKIIGAEATRADLLPAAEMFFHDEDQDVRTAMLENVDVFLTCLPKEEAERTLRSLLELWSTEFSCDWRLREKLALHIPSMARQFLLEDEDGNLVSLMHLALADPVSAVRDAGVRCVPDLYRSFAEHDQVIADGFLGMVSDLGESYRYRLRVACLFCIQALVESGIQRSACELLLLGKLIQMGSDPVVDVRISLARTVGMMCRKDELYALPQSRSSELNSLLARLGRDYSDEVKEAVQGILSEDEARRLGGVADSPVHQPRQLVLGPADGGPHKPELPQSFRLDGGMFGENGGHLFNMNDATAFSDVDIDNDGANHSFSFATTPGPSSGDDSGMVQDAERDSGRNTSLLGSDPFADDDDEPHHLLAVDQTEAHEESASTEQASASGRDVVSLSSLQRPLTGEAENNAAKATTAQEAGSPSGRSKTSDPFLAFVAGRRSQDLSRLKVDFEAMANAQKAEDDVNASKQMAAVEQKAALSTESLQSPGSEEGPGGNNSGDWAKLIKSGPATKDATALSGTEEDYVDVSAAESP